MSDITLLIDLAGAGNQDEFSEDFGLSDEMKKILEDEIKAQKHEKMRVAVKKIMKLNKAAAERRNDLVTQIRMARRTEAEAKAKLKEIERALAYAKETNNYLPLVRLTETVSISEYRDLEPNDPKWKVPAEWNPAAE